jgi:hypothetical protein
LQAEYRLLEARPLFGSGAFLVHLSLLISRQLNQFAGFRQRQFLAAFAAEGEAFPTLGAFSHYGTIQRMLAFSQ